MDATRFADRVISNLPFIADDTDYKAMVEDCKILFEEGFTIDEAVAYLSCMEMIRPELDEDIACHQMKDIREAVRERRDSEKKSTHPVWM